MKKIEVKEVENCEQIVLIFKLDDNNEWKKIDSFDPMKEYDSGLSTGYKGNGPQTLSKIIISNFNTYNDDKDYDDKFDDVLEYVSKLPKANSFIILEKDVKHLL